MKITKSQLKRIIKEELGRVLDQRSQSNILTEELGQWGRQSGDLSPDAMTLAYALHHWASRNSFDNFQHSTGLDLARFVQGELQQQEQGREPELFEFVSNLLGRERLKRDPDHALRAMGTVNEIVRHLNNEGYLKIDSDSTGGGSYLLKKRGYKPNHAITASREEVGQELNLNDNHIR